MRLYLLLALLIAGTRARNFLEDPKCPAVQPQASCAGRRSNCWSPGVRDTDCPGHGLCCYDGCANTCVSSAQPAPSAPKPVRQPPPTHKPRPRPTHKPRPRPTHKPQPPPLPVNNYIPPPPPKPVQTPAPSYIPPAPAPTHPPPPPPPATHPPAPSYPEVQQPSIQVEVSRPPPPPPPPGSCPAANPLPHTACAGRYSTCWSVGVADLDCPNWGLCCFDGCANTCLDSAPPPPPPVPAPAEPLPKYEPPRNPCDPNPCGPGSMCIPQEGEPECKCPEGLVPNPTPQHGCTVPNPCEPNPCGPGAMCIPQEGGPTCKCPEGLEPDPRPEIRCSPPRDPCNPSPCGPGTTCTPNRDGNPICRCLPGLIPKPDTITGCGPECVVDPDCQHGYVCRSQQCVERPDPCNPSPCGPGTTCMANRDGNPICKCLPGLIPKPDTITGCGPECVVDPDCRDGYICSEQRCVERPDPCDPNPCGEGALCLIQPGGTFSCECPTGTVGNGNTGCYRGECIVDDDCSLSTACQDYYCVDPCQSGTCSSTDFCRVMRHVPICGYNYDPPPPEPKDEFVIGERYAPQARPEVRNQVVIGATHQGKPAQPEGRNPFVVGGTDTSQREINRCAGRDCEGVRAMMMMMDTSNLPVIGASFNRKKRMILRRKKKSKTSK